MTAPQHDDIACSLITTRHQCFTRLAQYLQKIGNKAAAAVFRELAIQFPPSPDGVICCDEKIFFIPETEIEEAGGYQLLSDINSFNLAITAQNRLLEYFLEQSADAKSKTITNSADDLAKQAMSDAVTMRWLRKTHQRSLEQAPSSPCDYKAIDSLEKLEQGLVQYQPIFRAKMANTVSTSPLADLQACEAVYQFLMGVITQTPSQDVQSEAQIRCGEIIERMSQISSSV